MVKANAASFGRAAVILCTLSTVLLTLFLANCTPGPAKAPPFQCTDAIGCVTIAPAAPIKLGVIETLSGGSAPGGTEQVQSIQLAIAERGTQLLGHALALQIEDDRCSAEGGANAALKVVADPQMVGILGTNCSSAAVTAAPIMSKAGLVMISAANTSPGLTSVGGVRGDNWQPGYLRTVWNDAAMGAAAATFAYQRLGVTKAAVINAGDAYSKGLTNVFSQVFKKLGGQLVREITIDETDANQRPTLEAVALSGAQLVFFSLSQPQAGSRIVRQARAVPGLEALTFIGGEGMLSDVFIDAVGAAGLGVYLLGPAAPEGAANDQFRAAYQARYGARPLSFYYSFSSDATNLLLDAIQRVAIQEADGTLHLGRQALREALYATADFNGLTGRLKCDAYGDCGVAKLNIVKLDRPAMNVEELSANVVFTYTTATSASP